MNTNDRLRPQRSILVRSVSWALLLTFFALLTLGAGALSYTADEPAYVSGGYALLRGGPQALRMLAQRGYPPLAPVVDGSMLLLEPIRLPVATLPGWPDDFDHFAEDFQQALPDFDRAVFLTRLPTIWLTLLLAALVARWARELFGRAAGLLALGCLILDPTLLAHGSLATSDAAVTFFGAAALYGTWRWSRVGGWRWSLVAGALLGATLLSKVSGPIWGVSAAMLVVVALVRGYRQKDQRWRPYHAGAAAAVALLVLWAGYGFQWGRVGDTGPTVPTPSYWESAFYLTNYASVFYALGRRFFVSHWWYFPLAFLIKNPVPLLLTWFGAAFTLILSRRTRRDTVWVLVFPLTYGVVALFVGMNIGYRHILAIHPFLHVVAGGGLAFWWRTAPPWRRWMPAAAGLWSAVVVLQAFPNELAFFSSAVGGPDGGYRYLADSNLDWGQRTTRQQAAVEAADDGHAGSPSYTGPPEAPLRPPSGRYLIGASTLQGIGIGDLYTYEWFRHWPPTTTIDASLLVYDVPPLDVAWLAQCGTPTLPLDKVAIREGFGRVDLRSVGFDCTQAWLYPDGGQTSGVYVIDGDLLPATVPQTAFSLLAEQGQTSQPVASDDFIERSLAPARFSYLNLRAAVPFALYEWTPAQVRQQLRGSDGVYTVPLEAGPNDLQGRPTCATVGRGDGDACDLAGPLSFLGASLVKEGTTLEVETWWRVDDAPITRNFSIMAHLVTAEGDVIGNADGLGVWPMVLRKGDVFVQRHIFGAQVERPSLWLRTGVYWSDTMARWPTGDGEGTDTLLVELKH